MKKWFFPALLAVLLLAVLGCDVNETPTPDLPETVDGLTVVTTAEGNAAPTETEDVTETETEIGTQAMTETETQIVTETETVTGTETETVTETVAETETVTVTEAETEPVTETETQTVAETVTSESAETDEPPSETEILVGDALDVLVELILLSMAEHENDPIAVQISSEANLTFHILWFSKTVTVPLSGYYGTDNDQDMMISYDTPMTGTEVYTAANGMLYLQNGTGTALKAPLGDTSTDEVRAMLLNRLMGQLGTKLPGVPRPAAAGDFTDGASILPSSALDLNDLLALAFSSVSLEDIFTTAYAEYNLVDDSSCLVLSGLSDAVLDAVEELLTAPPEEDTPGGIVGSPTADALMALLREQADTAFSMTLKVDSYCNVTEAVITTALDLASIPELTVGIPVEMEIITRVTCNRENIIIEAPPDADRYTEVALKDLLPPKEEP